MNLKIGDIVINGFIAEIFEKNSEHAEGDWRNEKIYIYDGIGDASEEEVALVIEYLYSEGFIQDRKTEHTVLRPDDFE